MDEQTFDRTHKRIVQLNAAGEELTELTVPASSAKWTAVVDNTDIGTGATKRIPGDRLVILGTDRKIPAGLLPSYITSVDAVAALDRSVRPGNINTVYYETVGTACNYYRWVENTDDQSKSDYVPIANGLKVVDGDGTVVTDVLPQGAGRPHSRKVDVALGTPSARTLVSEPVLLVSGGKVVHAGSKNSGTFPGAQADPLGFGGKVKVSTHTADIAGHVFESSVSEVTVPATDADNGTPGLVKVNAAAGTVASIGSSASAGSSSLMAAADHVHTPGGKLTLYNLPHGNPVTYADIEYDLTAPVSVDCDDILHARLPSGDASSSASDPRGTEPAFLCADSTSASAWKSQHAWFTDTVVEGTSTGWKTSGQQVSTATVPASGLLYEAVLSLQVKIVNPVGQAQAVANLPGVYSFTVAFGGSVYRKFNLPASYLYGNGLVPVEVNLCALMKTSGTTVAVTVTEDSGDNAFGFRGASLRLKRLR